MCVCHVLCFCRELREKIQPEIMELIKQQRLNRLCEGTCFRKISSRRRQGEPRSAHIHDTHLCIQAYRRSEPTKLLLCSQSQFFSFLCVLVLYPSSVHPTHRHIIEIFEVLDCCGAALMMVHTNISGSVSLEGRGILRHDTYSNTCLGVYKHARHCRYMACKEMQMYIEPKAG